MQRSWDRKGTGIEALENSADFTCSYDIWQKKRRHALDRNRQINRRVHGERDDVWHAVLPRQCRSAAAPLRRLREGTGDQQHADAAVAP